MDEYTFTTQGGTEYGTGKTQPPKNRGGLVALLLILVIFLTGIVTVLGILNIQLFRKLNAQEELGDAAISFHQSLQETLPMDLHTAQEEEAAQFAMDLQGVQAPANVPQEGGLSLQDIYRKNIPSVVSVSCSGRGSNASGSGVVLSSDGYIVTTAHVLEGAVSITVQLSDGRVLHARVIGQDEASDLAVIHVDAKDLTPAVFGDSGLLQVGDAVVAIGDPLGVELRGTMTDGIVSAINRDVTLEGRTIGLIQTSAALNEGNSGGPLIDAQGYVIGINTMKIGDSISTAGVEGLGFAIPSATVKDIVDQLINQGYVSGQPTLGFSGESLSPFYQHYYHLPAGLFLTEVEPESLAARAGIEPGDILLSIDGEPVVTAEDLTRILFSRDIGDSVSVTFYRGGKQGTVTLTIQENKKG